MKYNILLHSNNGSPVYCNSKISLKCNNRKEDTAISMSLKLTDWEKDTYVFLPACVYDGNKFKKTFCPYPPMYEKCHLGLDPEPVISDIPALNPDGSGKIQVTAGDLSVPCVGIFYKNKKEALLILCEQQCKDKNIGFTVSQGAIEIHFPSMRENEYRMCSTYLASKDTGLHVEKGEIISSKVLIKEQKCDTLADFFEFFFKNRRSLLSDAPSKSGYSRGLWSTLEAHMNEDNYSGEYYAEASKKWQCGWVGGGMSSLPLLEYGAPISKARAKSTLDFLCSHISKAGFFYPIVENGVIKDDGFGREHMKNAVLTRKNGDVLYFLFKHFKITEPKPEWIRAARDVSDAFVRLFSKYGDFGQFIDTESGNILFGGTTSAAPVISALVSAYDYFGDKKYLSVAKDAGEKYYKSFVAKGVTYGGPGEALCAPDSESCYAMLEAMILLYETLGEECWLRYATDCLYIFSSWVMPYAYRFPSCSEFERLRINTVGSVFANAQNKHSAPGICTSSGDAIYKLYKYTNDKRVLELLYDIVSFIPQCISTSYRPIYSWDDPPRVLKPGWICERVNTSDWEGKECVGGVFYGTCWCETSALLTFSDLLFKDDIRRELNIPFID